MKKIICNCLILVTLFTFISCLSDPFAPGSIDRDGTINPPYAKTISIVVEKGTVSLSITDTDTGEKSIRANKKETKIRNATKTQILQQNSKISYSLYGNHIVVFDFTTIDKEAVFLITVDQETLSYKISSSDVLGKTVCLKNL